MNVPHHVKHHMQKQTLRKLVHAINTDFLALKLKIFSKKFLIFFLTFAQNMDHTVHPNTTNAERSSKRRYKQLFCGNTQGKKTY